MSELYTFENGKLKINLHAGQTRAWDSIKRYVFIIAGTQSGKTSFEPLWLDREIKEKGTGDYLAVTATYDLFKLKFLPEMQNFFVKLFHWQYSASEKVIWRKDKPRMFTRIIMRSADAEGGIESATAKAAIMDECGQDRFGLSAWDAVQRRLSLAEGRALGGTTPYNLGWLKTEIFDPWRAGDPDIQVVQFKSIMNPSFPRAEYYRQKKKQPAWKFEMFYNGNFSRPAGLIYDCLTQSHIVPPFEIPAPWPRFLGVDPGGHNTAKVWVAKDPTKNIFFQYRESLSGDKSTKEHVAEVRQYNENNITGWGGAKSETQFRQDWNAAGFPLTEPPVADVEAGIDRVYALLKEYRYYIFSTCRGTIDQAWTYARELDDNGKPTEKIKDKATYHYLDAVRYVSAGLDVPIQVFM